MALLNITTGFIVSIMFSSLTTVYAANEDTEKIKQLPGISIVGNKEAPKSLYIIPWQNPELKRSVKRSPDQINNIMQPLDRDSFRLQLQLYKLSNSNRYKLTP